MYSFSKAIRIKGTSLMRVDHSLSNTEQLCLLVVVASSIPAPTGHLMSLKGQELLAQVHLSLACFCTFVYIILLFIYLSSYH
jgi:hypothetical protein